ncbi:MAG: hypothetical protein O7D27_01220 [Alphaproteobacteria bacterium]|nr:hypothetical protein [Alphaproteobacteria bacterium]MCZ6610849.1 hypothetical protein [Alphaproteobacteria bacterium]MCZ6740758.1 hypothetical protein [Alphaproteobacteria bacterium]MCZ6848910.1 hypothetical protein [Alphaproteobacteria bacterium]
MRLIVSAVLLALMLAPSARAQPGKGYLGFAHKSDQGATNGATCRAFGGQLLRSEHYAVVIRMGRRDVELTNVIYHGGHKYVSFSMETSSFWGRGETVVALCHFAG